jgi:ELWxxDGT repeat protein
MKKSYLLSYFIVLIFHFSFAQSIDATLVEINFQSDSHPQQLTAFQSGFYFTATDGVFADFGRELWYCDGTAQGIQMIKDIRAGQNDSDPENLLVINNTLYFTANDGIHGTELWKSDGTEAGTVLVKDIRTSNNDEFNGPDNLVNFNGSLFFVATDGTNDRELWKSDGTEAGTVLVKNIRQNGSSGPSSLFVFNNTLYFVADNGIDGKELWKSDGTEAGTTMVIDINSNSSPSFNTTNQFITLNNHFYFYASNGGNGLELWKSDGTETGTTMVKDIAPGVSSSNFILKGSVLNNEIIFEASNASDGLEIWKTDGTEAGTTMIRNINGIGSSSISNNSVYINFNNEVYFLANDNIHGNEVWKTDGTTVGTSLLKDIRTGSASIWFTNFHVDTANNRLLFFAEGDPNSSARTLWGSDGTTNGTIELSTVEDSNTSGLVENFISLNNITVFTGENSIYGNELWFTDGTTNGTEFFADMNYSNSSNPSKFTNVNGELFFRARGLDSGEQLFKSDGTIQGTEMVKNINPSGGSSIGDNAQMVNINGTLFFTAFDGTNGYELWKSDGTENGTVMVKDINPGSQSSMFSSSDTQPLTAIDNILYFYANDGVNGRELWRSDGTDAGTFMIKDIYPGSSNSSFPRSFVKFNNTIYFIANDNMGSALWTTDGTDAGTVKVTTLNDMRILKTVNNKLIIVAETSGTTYGPHDIWVSDGTDAGTTFLQGFGDGIDSNIAFTTILNDEFYFVAKHPVFGRKSIYKTDGTVAGTVLLYDGSTHPTIPNIDIDDILTCGNYVYFAIQTSTGSNQELWRTDGTTTTQVADNTTDDFLFIRGFTCYNNNLLYLAESNANKIWAIGDNLINPVQLDINVLNGPALSGFSPIQQIGATDSNIFFSGRTDDSGVELYIADIDASLLSVDEFETNVTNAQGKLIQAYPNPASANVTIQSLINANITSFEVYNLSGQKLHTYVNENITRNVDYDVKHLNAGMYFIKAKLSDGSMSNVKLLVN